MRSAQVALAARTGSDRSEPPPARRGSATLSLVLAVAIVLLALAGGLAPSLLPGTLVGRDAGWVPATWTGPPTAAAGAAAPAAAVRRGGVVGSRATTWPATTSRTWAAALASSWVASPIRSR